MQRTIGRAGEEVGGDLDAGSLQAQHAGLRAAEEQGHRQRHPGVPASDDDERDRDQPLALGHVLRPGLGVVDAEHGARPGPRADRPRGSPGAGSASAECREPWRHPANSPTARQRRPGAGAVEPEREGGHQRQRQDGADGELAQKTVERPEAGVRGGKQCAEAVDLRTDERPAEEGGKAQPQHPHRDAAADLVGMRAEAKTGVDERQHGPGEGAHEAARSRDRRWCWRAQSRRTPRPASGLPRRD